MKKEFLLVVICAVPSCMGPKYKQPKHRMPQSFDYDCDTRTNQPLTKWWRQFHDATLNQLINQAIRANYDLKIAQEQIEESRALYQFKKAQLYPQLDVITEARHTRFSQQLAQTSFLTKPNVSFLQLGTDAFWELDFWGRLQHERDAQWYAFQAQIEQMRTVYVILLAEVARNYIDLCAFAKKIDLLQKKGIVDQALVTLQKDLYCAGISSEIAVTEQQQILASTLDLLEQLRIAYAQTKHQLAVLLGLNPEQLSFQTLRTTIPLSTYRISAGIPSDILRRRPDIRQAERLIAATNESIGAAIAEWFPRFTLLGGVNSEASKLKNWFTGKSLSWFIGPSIRWPIINFGRIKANIHVEESRKRQAILSYSNTIINALKDVEDFLAAYCYNKEQLSILTYKYKQAFQQEQLTAAKYCAGLANELVYLNAQSNRITVALQVADSCQALSGRLVGLYKALGGGW